MKTVMKYYLRGITSLALLFILAHPALADEAAAQLNHRDKIYEIARWGQDLVAVGYPGLFLRSRDNGKTWRKETVSSDAAFFAFAAFDEKTALMTGPTGLILRTEDGGRSWSKIESGVKPPLFDVAVAENSGHSWVVGHFNTILHSADKGKTWRRQEYKLPEDAEDEPGLNAVSFIDERNGWIVGEFGIVLATSDGGQSWRAKPTPTEVPLYDVAFTSAENGVAVGTGGLVLVTNDGAETWERRPAAIKQHLFGFQIVQDTIVAVGQDGFFVKSPLDGEGCWTTGRTGVYTWLDTVFFLTPRHGFAAGGRGSILETRDGGKTWRQLTGR